MENKYNQGKIYKIVCNITNEIYYGSTIRTLNQRLRLHTINKTCVSRNIIDKGNYKIELIKNYPCNSKYELEEEERKYILENECINITIPHRTKKEWNEDNKEKLNNQMKKYYQNNKDKLIEKQKKYYQDNKIQVNKNSKEYYENNKEEILEYKKKWKKENYEKNKEEILQKLKEKITCECGSIIRKNDISIHRRTKKHIKFLEEKST